MISMTEQYRDDDSIHEGEELEEGGAALYSRYLMLNFSYLYGLPQTPLKVCPAAIYVCHLNIFWEIKYSI